MGHEIEFSDRQLHIVDRGAYGCSEFQFCLKFSAPSFEFLDENFRIRGSFFDRPKFRGWLLPPLPRRRWSELWQRYCITLLPRLLQLHSLMPRWRQWIVTAFNWFWSRSTYCVNSRISQKAFDCRIFCNYFWFDFCFYWSCILVLLWSPKVTLWNCFSKLLTVWLPFSPN